MARGYGLAVALALCAVKVQARPARPSLVVVLVVDQLPVRLYDRVLPELPQGGLRRLAAGGANFIGRYGHANTSTAPGHALLVTGADAGRSGIVGNEWWDRLRWRPVYAVEDSAYHVLGRTPREHEGTSPRLLRVAGVADSLGFATLGRGRVVALSWKDRTAILLAGQHPNAAVWFDSTQASFTSSSYYGERVPDFVAAAAAHRPPSSLIGQVWRPVAPEQKLAQLGGEDAAKGEGDYEGLGTVFPHPIQSPRALAATPQANQLLLELAVGALAGERLGTHEVPDLLLVSFSATDYVGHIFGPDSREAVDTLFQLDRGLAELLRRLDGLVGRDRYAVVLTSDHGVASLPERAQARAAHRLPSDDEIARRVEKSVVAAAGAGWRVAFAHPHLYLGPPAGARATAIDAARTVARHALAALPGVESVFVPAEAVPAKDEVARAVLAGWDPDRSGDLYLILAPGSVFEEEIVPGAGTGHGSPRDYDREVPLVFYGAGVAQAPRAAAPVPQESVAATIAALLGVPPPPAAERPALRAALAE
jgi:arylsulfatase A-like enzyme